MSQDQRQKVILIGLGVLIVGFGAYYFVFRESGTAQVAQVQTAPTERKARGADAAPEKRVERKSREVEAEASEETAERKTRDVEEREERVREERDTGRREKTKKVKTIAPPA
ncbi:MAG: hypothetical protein HY763_16515 [Planctomycetes bacterium]|nr:hypothetical protein [Planctomycetota bacterium]